jgi:hypothetical protein
VKTKIVNVNGVATEVSFRIVQADPATGQMLVRYFNTDHPDGSLNRVELPVENGVLKALQDDALDDYIIGFGPMGEFARTEVAKVPPVDLSYLLALVEPDHVIPPPPPPPLPPPPTLMELVV